ncbi:TPA: hypothetical protein NJ076_000071 [Vibrio parahaemolyticus]|nr:hypothetical protein [Vibrio parahaemolyticus]
MTTLAYHHESGIIAFDSRLTQGRTIISDNVTKLYEKGKSILILAGDLSEVQRLVSDYPSEKGKYRVVGFIVEDNQVYSCSWDGEAHERVLTCWNDAWGSGSDHALTAMDMGAGAQDAVEKATLRDIYSGGKVISIDTRAVSVNT